MGKKVIAARVAAELQNDGNVRVILTKGKLGEFSVSIDGQKLIETARFLYPRANRIVQQVRTLSVQSE